MSIPVQPATSRSARFYQESVVFEIEGTLYRVPKNGFQRYSQSFFAIMFNLPQGPGERREGDSDENPIRAPQVTAEEFESLLEVLYPLQCTGPPDLSKQQWVSVLRLSRQWDMPELAALAVQKMDDLNITAIEKVKLGITHSVPQWLKEGCSALVGEVGSVSLEELKSLGNEAALRILYIQSLTQLVDKDEIYCESCLNKGIWNRIQQQGLEQPDTYTCTQAKCRAKITGGYAYVDLTRSKPTVIANKVAELFRDEIEEAERWKPSGADQ